MSNKNSNKNFKKMLITKFLHFRSFDKVDYSKIEDILIIRNIKNFRLLEKNSYNYNLSAKREFIKIVEIYKLYLEKVKNSNKISEKNRLILEYKISDAIKKWYNNIGWISSMLGSHPFIYNWPASKQF